MQWEYTTWVQHPYSVPFGWEASHLTQMGQNGWELAAVLVDGPNRTWVFKKEINVGPGPIVLGSHNRLNPTPISIPAGRVICKIATDHSVTLANDITFPELAQMDLDTLLTLQAIIAKAIALKKESICSTKT